MGVLDDDYLQRSCAAAILVQAVSHQHPGDVCRVDIDQCGNVVREVCDHPDTNQGLSAFKLGLVLADKMGFCHNDWIVRAVLYVVSIVHSLPADDFDGRGKKCAAASGSAST